jgi:hypothetical protein
VRFMLHEKSIYLARVRACLNGPRVRTMVAFVASLNSRDCRAGRKPFETLRDWFCNRYSPVFLGLLNTKDMDVKKNNQKKTME